MKHFVMYNDSEALWCYEEEAYEKLTMGWTLHAVAYDEKTADELAEETQYSFLNVYSLTCL